MVKRALDVLLSSVALIVFLPLLIPVAIILRLTGDGYIFYRQQRVGKDGRIFGLYKFATMIENSPNLPGGLLTAKHDPRVLPVGRILRATKVNEIPQLLNVLRGDMSLIGPRPQTVLHFEVFPEHVKREIIRVRPGLSGIGSVVFRNEDSVLAHCGKDAAGFYAEDIAPYKGELETWYVRNQRGLLDLLLILLTVWVVLFPQSRWHFTFLDGLPQPKSQVLADLLGMKAADKEIVLDVRPGSVARSAVP